jgi:hypothetical protein
MKFPLFCSHMMIWSIIWEVNEFVGYLEFFFVLLHAWSVIKYCYSLPMVFVTGNWKRGFQTRFQLSCIQNPGRPVSFFHPPSDISTWVITVPYQESLVPHFVNRTPSLEHVMSLIRKAAFCILCKQNSQIMLFWKLYLSETQCNAVLSTLPNLPS